MPDPKLPERPSLEYLKKLAKQRLQELRRADPDAKLAAALLGVAREYGFISWRALKAQIDRQRARKIASPVMRFLPVSDTSRSIAFYHDVLGSEVKQENDSVDVVLGPARIRFGKEGYEPGDHGFQASRRPGSAILFLQADDVVATHAAIELAEALRAISNE